MGLRVPATLHRCMVINVSGEHPSIFFLPLPDHKRKRPVESYDPTGPYEPRQRPTVPLPHSSSIIGLGGLNFRVRDGNGCDPSGKATGNSEEFVDLLIV